MLLSRSKARFVTEAALLGLLAVSVAGCNAESFGFLGTTTSSNSSSNSSSGGGSTKVTVISIPTPQLALVTLGLLNGTKLSPFQQALVVNGGTPPYQFEITSGALPAGMGLDTQSGLISGTPSVSGSFSVGIKVTDSASPTPASVNKVYSMVVNAAGSPSINNATLPSGQVGFPYIQAVLVSQGIPPYTFTLPSFPGSTGLPAGLSLSGSTGAITGTPTTAGTSLFQVLVTDAAGGTAAQLYSVQVTGTNYQPLAFGGTAFLPVVSGANESRSIAVNGGVPPYVLSVVSGAIPAGMTFTNGVISGIPSQTSGLPATSNFRVQLRDQQNTTLTQDFALKVVAPLQISGISTITAYQNVIFSSSLSATGGSGTYSFSQTGLPTNASANFSLLSDGSILGLATVAPGTSYNFNARVTDSDGLTFTRAMVLNISQPLAISATSLPAALVGKPYLTSGAAAVSLGAVGGLGPLTYSVTSGTLPQGLSLNSSTGVISGTPAPGANVRTGNFPITFSVSDIPYGNSTVTKNLTISVVIPPRIQNDIVHKFRPAASGAPVGYVYTDYLRVEGGFGNLSYSATNLPPGLTINSTSGYVSGRPTGSPGTYQVDFTVTDGNGFSDTRQKKMRVVGAAKTPAFDRPIGQAIAAHQRHARFFAAGYLNDDANLDIATHFWSTNGLVVGLGGGDGTFNKGLANNANHAHMDNRFASQCPNEMMIRKMHEGDNARDIVTLFRNCNAPGIVTMKGNTSADAATWLTNFSNSDRQRMEFSAGGLYNPMSMNFGRIHSGAPDLDDMVFTTDNQQVVGISLNCGNQSSVLFPDGTTSIACSNANTNLSLYGSQIFNYRTIILSTAPYNVTSWGIALVDLDNDAIRDLVFTTLNGGSRLFVMKGRATPSANSNEGNALTRPFDAPIEVTNVSFSGAGFQEGGARITAQDILGNNLDFNSDNKPDIVVNSSTGATIFFGNGAGGFSSISNISNTDIGTNNYVARVGELNGDGCLDVVTSVAWAARNHLQVWYNQKSGSTCTGTFSRTTGRHIYFGSFLSLDLALGKLLNINYPADPPTSSLDLMTNSTEISVPHISTWVNSGSTAMPFRGGLTTPNNPSSGVGPSFYVRSPAVDETSYGPPLISDINGDAYPDVVVKGNGGAGVFLGGSGGTLTIQPTNILTMGNTEWWQWNQQELADLNGDGIKDYISNNIATPSIGINLGVGDGTFNPLVSVTDGADLSLNCSARAMALADLNKDGKLDLVTGGHCNNPRIAIHPGLGDGTFNMTTGVVVLSPGANEWYNALAIADVNKDGTLDIIATDQRGPLGISIYLANGSNFSYAAPSGGAGTFVQVSGFGTNTVQSLELGDVNNDGSLDIAISSLQHHYWAVLLGNNGAFNVGTTLFESPNYGLHGSFNGLRLADWDDDGYLDVLVAKQQNGIFLYRNTKTNTIFPTLPTMGPYLPGNAVADEMFAIPAVGDLNGDDLPDVLTQGQVYGLGVSYNQSY